MTPKEKAKELFDRYYAITGPFTESKRCALIAVDELIESHLILTNTHVSKPSIRCKRFWQQVKQEIEKL